ncbi:DUF6082 family protein [Streptomyces chartreusis]|uniref:Uncharacterized protein n=1 Tax=Streptomyces chartreusis TaxID=1969 RepID=A0A7H8TBP4_STRCX|nr:DUF6082 family protein [Streptomyces chartreusis]QKZ20929.1 hypothetical protein HUT05_28445 [Streptomyces chartreusis]
MQVRQNKWVGWWLAGVAAFIVILATPFLLESVAPDGHNWERLSSISQTYSAMSVLFSAAALLGVVVSIRHQAKQTNIANEEAQRAWHRELVLFLVQHPELRPATDAPRVPTTELQARQMMISNLFLASWHSDYLLHRSNSQRLRVTLQLHFRSALAREHWARASTTWRQTAETHSNPRHVGFVDLVDEAYAAAVAAGPGVPPEAFCAPSDT